MSEDVGLVIEVIKSDFKYKMRYSEVRRDWGIFIYAYDEVTCIARFKNILNAKEMMRLLELSE